MRAAGEGVHHSPRRCWVLGVEHGTKVAQLCFDAGLESRGMGTVEADRIEVLLALAVWEADNVEARGGEGPEHRQIEAKRVDDHAEVGIPTRFSVSGCPVNRSLIALDCCYVANK
jgi:hypothetical protein